MKRSALAGMTLASFALASCSFEIGDIGESEDSRYQMVLEESGGYLLDTATGALYQEQDGRWVSVVGSPES